VSWAHIRSYILISSYTLSRLRSAQAAGEAEGKAQTGEAPSYTRSPTDQVRPSVRHHHRRRPGDAHQAPSGADADLLLKIDSTRGDQCVPYCQCASVDFAHLRSAANAGKDQTPHDLFGISLCRSRHEEQHRIGFGVFAKKYGINLWALAAEFARKSPDWEMRASLNSSVPKKPPADEREPRAMPRIVVQFEIEN